MWDRGTSEGHEDQKAIADIMLSSFFRLFLHQQIGIECTPPPAPPLPGADLNAGDMAVNKTGRICPLTELELPVIITVDTSQKF